MNNCGITVRDVCFLIWQYVELEEELVSGYNEGLCEKNIHDFFGHEEVTFLWDINFHLLLVFVATFIGLSKEDIKSWS